MTDQETRELVQRIHGEQTNGRTTDSEPPTIHYTELKPDDPDSPLYHGWETYRREIGRLLAEGNEGRWVLIKGERIIGMWNEWREAMHIARVVFHDQPFLVHQIQERERVIICNKLWRYLS